MRRDDTSRGCKDARLGSSEKYLELYINKKYFTELTILTKFSKKGTSFMSS